MDAFANSQGQKRDQEEQEQRPEGSGLADGRRSCAPAVLPQGLARGAQCVRCRRQNGGILVRSACGRSSGACHGLDLGRVDRRRRGRLALQACSQAERCVLEAEGRGLEALGCRADGSGCIRERANSVAGRANRRGHPRRRRGRGKGHHACGPSGQDDNGPAHATAAARLFFGAPVEAAAPAASQAVQERRQQPQHHADDHVGASHVADAPEVILELGGRWVER
mmetsp:Transcript_11545/g.44786  ORF Transcript_11545/g.44786 Transcript_11545/m.44786 type:complete len:224 (-) Transcript_11545:119-790(-)